LHVPRRGKEKTLESHPGLAFPAENRRFPAPAPRLPGNAGRRPQATPDRDASSEGNAVGQRAQDQWLADTKLTTGSWSAVAVYFAQSDHLVWIA
jgi:hypothetical protein